jgi:hypothetical protein
MDRHPPTDSDPKVIGTTAVVGMQMGTEMDIVTGMVISTVMRMVTAVS